MMVKMSNIAKKLLIPLSPIFISGCSVMNHGSNKGENVFYTFTWPTILITFIITTAILWVIRYFVKNHTS